MRFKVEKTSWYEIAIRPKGIAKKKKVRKKCVAHQLVASHWIISIHYFAELCRQKQIALSLVAISFAMQDEGRKEMIKQKMALQSKCWNTQKWEKRNSASERPEQSLSDIGGSHLGKRERGGIHGHGSTILHSADKRNPPLLGPTYRGDEPFSWRRAWDAEGDVGVYPGATRFLRPIRRNKSFRAMIFHSNYSTQFIANVSCNLLARANKNMRSLLVCIFIARHYVLIWFWFPPRTIMELWRMMFQVRDQTMYHISKQSLAKPTNCFLRTVKCIQIANLAPLRKVSVT